MNLCHDSAEAFEKKCEVYLRRRCRFHTSVPYIYPAVTATLGMKGRYCPSLSRSRFVFNGLDFNCRKRCRKVTNIYLSCGHVFIVEK